MSFVTLAIAILALALSVTVERRTRSTARREYRAATLDLALDVDTTLSVLYSNVLTVDPAGYREDVAETINAIRAKLPDLMRKSTMVRERLEQLSDRAELDDINVMLRSLRADTQALAASMSHGLERGRATHPAAAADRPAGGVEL